MISESIQVELEEFFNTKVASINPVHGGDINEAFQIILNDKREYFIKSNDRFKTLFEAEAQGLKLLLSANHSLIIPKVIFYNERILALEYLKEKVQTNQEDSFSLGQGLAKLHSNTSDFFGLDHSNYIGSLHQSNTMHEQWAEFFLSERIEPQIQLAHKKGSLTTITSSHLQKLHKVVEEVCPNEPAALLHGDLWSGNYFITNQGPAIFDPAIYYGQREMDLAMTKLFGGFESSFYEGYESISPLQPKFGDRIHLYNLYPILVHANIFGGHYIDRAKQIILHYAS